MKNNLSVLLKMSGNFLERLVDKNEIREKLIPVLKEINAIE